MTSFALKQNGLAWTAPVCVCYGVLCLLASLIAQYALDLAPCKLCLIQRTIAALLVAAALFEMLMRSRGVSSWITRLILLAMVAVASYHFAIQMGWMADPCRLPATAIDSVSDFKQLLQAAPSCSKAAFKVLGLPGPIVNMLFAAVALCASFNHRSELASIE